MANLSNINNKFIVTSETEALIGATSWSGVGSGTLAAGLIISGNTSQFILDNPSYNHFTMYSAGDSNIYNIFGSSGNYLIGTGNKDTSSWSEKMRIDNSGNVGIGVTPSAWQTISNSNALQFYGSYIYNYRDTNLLIGNNAYYDGAWKYYKASIGATKFNSGSGAFDFAVSSGGNANAAITWIDALKIDSSGNVGIGTATPQTTLDVKGAASALNAHFGQGANNSSGVFGGISLGYSEAGNAGYRKVGIVAKAIGDGAARQELHFLVDTNADGNSAGIADSKMMINTSGNVGIGTSSPASSYGFTKTLEIQGAADAEINISQSNNSKHWSLGIVNGANYQQTTSGQQYIWLIGGSEKMRISNTGNVGIGENSPTLGKLQIRTSSAVAFSPTVFTSGANLRLQTGGTAAAGITTGISMGVGGSAEAYIGAVQNVSTYADIVFQTYHGAYGERMRINSIGNVGIGIASPAAKLDVLQETRISYLQGNQYRTRITNTDGNTRILSDGAQCNIIFGTTAAVTGGTASEKMRIDWRGNVGIGTTSPDSKLQVVAGNSQEQAWFGETGYTNAAVRIGGDNGGGGRLYIQYAGDSSYIDCYGGHGSTERYRDLGLYARNLKFFTTSSGSPSEVMRITSGGTTEFKKNVDILTDQNTNILKVRSTSGSFTSSILLVDCDRGTTNNTYNLANFAQLGNAKCVITDGGDLKNTNNSYGALSDERLKENIIDATPKLDDLMKVKIKTFNLKGDEQKQIGVVAQELEEVFPGMVSSAKTPDSEDETLYKSVKYSVFVPMLIKAIQELKANNDSLKARIEILEDK